MFKFLNRLFSPEPVAKKSVKSPPLRIAEHHIVLGKTSVVYFLRRRPPQHTSQGIRLTIRHQQIFITAPSWILLHHIESFLLEKTDWLTHHLAQQNSQQNIKTSAQRFFPGTVHDYLGQSYTLRLLPTDKQAIKKTQPNLFQIRTDTQELLIPFEQRSNPSNLNEDFHLATLEMLQQNALTHFKQRVDFFIRDINDRGLSSVALLCQNPRVSLTNARGRWGSCSSTGTIRLHWRLIHLAHTLLDYVVAHEVAHLAYMNHSAQFWQLVARLIPDYKTRQSQLKQFAVLLSLSV